MTKNPFAVYSPEDMSPEEFKSIFVKERTWLNALETPKDYFVHGSRGSGKSMLLNYLEFSHRLCYFENSLSKFLKENGEHKYIGIMVHITRWELNTQRYELLIKNNFAEKCIVTELCMHDLIMTILYRILKTFIETNEMAKYINDFDSKKIKDFCVKVTSNLDALNIHTVSFDGDYINTELLRILASIFSKERTFIKLYANETFQMRLCNYKGNYSSFMFMHDFIIQIKRLLNLEDYSFYILLDDGDDTKKTMQQCIDSLISQRQHKVVCFKVAVKKGVFWDYGNIERPHDYSQIDDIDELYSTNPTYYKRIDEIANKRLRLTDINVTIEDFLPESPSEKEKLQEIKRELKQRYEQEYDEKVRQKTDNSIPSKSDYINNRISKYAPAELFRRLKKTGKSYAGFENIVYLSSGIIRQFLDIGSYMFDEEVKKRGNVKITRIRLSTQKKVIKNYADSFMDELEKKYKGFEEEGSLEEAKKYKNLYALIESLGKYYRDRLMKTGAEPRMFTFTLKDPDTDPEIGKILELGVNENYFQSYWYSSKVGVGKYRGYAFNRRLCPRYGIDPTAFRGRKELTTSELKSAIKTKKIPKSAFDAREKDISLDQYFGEGV
jgi:uncharacterized membrane protein YwzB